MRLFYAIEFEEDDKEYLSKVQCEVKKHSKKGNFTRKSNFHLTLKFIGEISPNEIKKYKTIADEVAYNIEPFKIKIKDLGQFPRKQRKIVWMGIEDEKNMLSILRTKLCYNLNKMGIFEDDDNYIPHITLGREVLFEKHFESLKQEIIIEPRKIYVKGISLMESTRVKGLLTYLPIHFSFFHI